MICDFFVVIDEHSAGTHRHKTDHVENEQIFFFSINRQTWLCRFFPPSHSPTLKQTRRTVGRCHDYYYTTSPSIIIYCCRFDNNTPRMTHYFRAKQAFDESPHTGGWPKRHITWSKLCKVILLPKILLFFRFSSKKLEIRLSLYIRTCFNLYPLGLSKIEPCDPNALPLIFLLNCYHGPTFVTKH